MNAIRLYRQSSRLVLIAWALAFSTGASAAEGSTADSVRAPASVQSQPSQIEVEYWKSAEKIGSAAAYRAYLDIFPNGYFSKLAVAALAGDAGAKESSSLGPRPAPASTPAPLTPELIARIAADPETGAIEFRVGDSFLGPGPVTVGWFGAKKQFLVPNGHWMVLAATDGYSTHVRRIRLTSIAFGSFEGNRLRSIVAVIFNSRPGPAAAWTAAQRCESGDPAAVTTWRTQAPTLRQCATIKPVAKFSQPESWRGDFWESVYRTLVRLESPLAAQEVLRSDLYFTDNRSGYMQIIRYDLGQTSPAKFEQSSTTQSSPSAEFVARRTEWIKAYASLASKAFLREIAMEDIRVGDRIAVTTLSLPD